mmetsp:Transcript_10166/g.8711  ORF Transcript_10166/g.8711 Transcript_10166/m.8711 type:complete len:280 (-) Transcript_10166:737-1576(-)
MIPSPPPTENLEYGSTDYQKFEDIGEKELDKVAFCLVAGGLGERLGYPGIKVAIPIDLVIEMQFLKYYAEYILAYQKRYCKNTEIPFAIMTSDDTNDLTLKLLESNDYFGLSKKQLTVMKQEKVPALLNNDGHFALEEKSLSIQTKPHGHGDVHTLIYQHGLAKKWSDEGRKWLVFFQDTNPLVFRSLPAFLGVSEERNFELNSIVVPRKPGEAVGALCTLTRTDNTKLTINVEYNQLDALFKALGGENVDDKGFSTFPGNINCLIFRIPEYSQTLEKT